MKLKFIKIPGQNYEMLEAPVTQRIWVNHMTLNPSYFKWDSAIDHPVESVSFEDCNKFIEIINAKSKKFNYRLPTEAEWEFCCRAGSQAHYCFGNSIETLKDYAWFNANSSSTQQVKSKKPNAFGLYDMHGNVWEWCADTHGTLSPAHVLRGGSWGSDEYLARSDSRTFAGNIVRSNSVGFRVLRTPINTKRDQTPMIDSSKIESLHKAVAEAQESIDRVRKLLIENGII